MSPEKEKYYSARMFELAEMFNLYAKRFEAIQPLDPEIDLSKISDKQMDEIIGQADPQLLLLRDENRTFANQISKEFDADGYTTDDWNNLMKRSGAVQAFGFRDN